MKDSQAKPTPTSTPAAGGPLPPVPFLLLKGGNGRRWRVSLGLALQSLLVALLLLMPLFSPDQINGAASGPPRILVPLQRGDPAGQPKVKHPGAQRDPGPRPLPTHKLTIPVRVPDQTPPGDLGPVNHAGFGPGPGNIPLGVPTGTEGGVPLTSFQPLGPPVRPPAPQQPVRVGGHIRPPRLLHRVEPEYPRVARQIRIEGTVVLEALLGTDGRVRQITAKSGHPLLVRAARAAVAQWVYEPTYLNDQPVPVLLEVKVEFRLRR